MTQNAPSNTTEKASHDEAFKERPVADSEAAEQLGDQALENVSGGMLYTNIKELDKRHTFLTQ
jgi:hypothetical protein